MKTILALGALLSLSFVSAQTNPNLTSSGYVEFAPAANATALNPLTPTQHGWSYVGSSGTVYFHHRFYGNGEDFRIRKLSLSTDQDGDGNYTSYTDISALPTPGSGNPQYILLKDGVVLPNTVMKNSICDEVVILNHSFLGRSFTGGVRWKLETDFPDVIQWTTHGPINPFNGISIQPYGGKKGELYIIADGMIGQNVQYSYDLVNWSDYFTLAHGGITILSPPAIEVGKPKKFFRLPLP